MLEAPLHERQRRRGGGVRAAAGPIRDLLPPLTPLTQRAFFGTFEGSLGRPCRGSALGLPLVCRPGLRICRSQPSPCRRCAAHVPTASGTVLADEADQAKRLSHSRTPAAHGA